MIPGERDPGPDAGRTLAETLDRACASAIGAVGVDGAGITVMGSLADGLDGARDQIAATGAVSRRLEDLQLTAGEGPCLDAFATGVPVLVADLAAEPTLWLGFAREAIAAGAAAVFSLPLQVGAIRLGTLDLHRSTVGGLSREQLAAALTLAELATQALLEQAADVDDRWLPGVHADVHQASGMVSVQAGVAVGVAMLRLRAFAFARGEPLHDVARRVIERTLVLDDAADRPGSPPDDSVGGGHPTPDPEDEDR